MIDRKSKAGRRRQPYITSGHSCQVAKARADFKFMQVQPQPGETRGNRMLTSGIKHIKERSKANRRRFSKGQLYCLVLSAMTIITHQEKLRFRVQMELAQQQGRRLPQPFYSVLSEINPPKSMP